MKECYLYKRLNKNKVQCNTCAHRCIIASGKRGICGVRENKKGKLYLLVYGYAVAVHIDPIEKKPLYHFLKNSYTLSFATIGCNFRCDNCQNYDISQASKSGKSIIQFQKMAQALSPQEIVKITLQNKLPSISYTYTEPTIFLEYALDTMKIAQQNGLKNIWVSNGYMTEKTINLIAPYLDAINVDLKSFSDKFYLQNCGAKIGPVLKSLKLLKQNNIWLEVTTLLIPGLTDSSDNLKKIAQFIHDELGPETPWHVTAFSGSYSWHLKHLPDTPYEKVKNAYDIGKTQGLANVHIGNV